MTIKDDTIDKERVSMGLKKRDQNDITSILQGDDQIFKTWVATPREPIGISEYKENEKTITTIVPKLVATMALGNLNTKEVQLMRLYFEIARRAQRHGFMNVAINLYYKVVLLCLSSQSHMAFLARQLFTENVNVLRKEETMSDTRDSTPQKKDVFASLQERLKKTDGSAFMGEKYKNDSYGIRSS